MRKQNNDVSDFGKIFIRDGHNKNVFLIVLIYLFIGGLWIYYSDEFVMAVSTDPVTITQLQTYKGWLYVFVTAILLFFMINRLYKQIKSYYDQATEKHISLKLILDHIGSVIWTVDKQLCFTSSYGSGLKKLNLKPYEVVGKTLYEYFNTNDHSYLPIASHLKTLTGETVYFEMKMKNITYQCHLEPMKDKDGKINGVIGVAVDITEHKLMEERLKNQLDELIQWKNVILNREEKILELKKQVNDLLHELGRPVRYSNV